MSTESRRFLRRVTIAVMKYSMALLVQTFPCVLPSYVRLFWRLLLISTLDEETDVECELLFVLERLSEKLRFMSSILTPESMLLSPPPPPPAYEMVSKQQWWEKALTNGQSLTWIVRILEYYCVALTDECDNIAFLHWYSSALFSCFPTYQRTHIEKFTFRIDQELS